EQDAIDCLAIAGAGLTNRHAHARLIDEAAVSDIDRQNVFTFVRSNRRRRRARRWRSSADTTERDHFVLADLETALHAVRITEEQRHHCEREYDFFHRLLQVLDANAIGNEIGNESLAPDIAHVTAAMDGNPRCRNRRGLTERSLFWSAGGSIGKLFIIRAE